MIRAVLAAAVVLTACAGTAPPVADGTARPDGDAGSLVVVDRVVDGDTIEVRSGATVTPVRLIGIDTPEKDGSGRPAECYGAEATAYLTQRLPPGTPVTLVGDDERRDRYDRLLAYVLTSDDVLVNLELVDAGYAAAFPFEPNTTLAAEFARAERRAAELGIGLWGRCGGPDTPVDSVAG